jgi:hypothetical protein
MRIQGLVTRGYPAPRASCATYAPGVVPKEAKAPTAVELRALVERAGREVLWFEDDDKNDLRYCFEPSGCLEVRSRCFTCKEIAGRWHLSCTRVEPNPDTCRPLHQHQWAGARFYMDVPEQSADTNTFTLRPH